MGSNGTVAVLGTGIMGSAMARRLAATGFDTRAWNRTAWRAAPLADDGVSVADDPVQAVKGADFVITALADGAAVDAVMFGQDGAAAGMDAETLWLQMSTVGVKATEGLERDADFCGLTMIDAPVLGSPSRAERGQLVVLASGPDNVAERCNTVLDTLGSKVYWLGPAGGGSRTIMVMHAWLTGLVGTLAESVALAQASGLDPSLLLDTIAESLVGATFAQHKADAMLTARFPASQPLRLALKDVRLVQEAAADLDLPLPVTGAVAQQLGRAVQLGHADEDMAAVYFAVSGNRPRP